MRFLASLLCVGLALAVAGCDPVTDRRMFSKGIGSDLYTADALAVAQEQDEYIDAICDQAGFVHPGKGRICSSGQFVTSATVWTQFVQAGMNDIDRRCDAYLVWLDNIRRAEAPNLKQIADAHAATQLILQATSAGVTPMALVAVAFGLAADTLTNINSRLILQVNHSTVQAVVLSRQRDYRKELLGDAKTKPRVIIDNRPAAIYALRNYMRLCMPMTIETEINNTIVAYERGGPDALRGERMITATSIARPVSADDRIRKTPRPKTNTDPEYAKIIKQYRPEVHSVAKVERALRRLCLPEGTPVTSAVNTQIKVFQLTERRAATGVLTDPELDLLANAPVCTPNAVRNYFEKNKMQKDFTDIVAGEADKASTIKDMNLLLLPEQQITKDTTLAVIRSRIADVKRVLRIKSESNPAWQERAKLQIPDADLPDQFSPDFLSALVYYRIAIMPRETAPTTPSPASPPASNPTPGSGGG